MAIQFPCGCKFDSEQIKHPDKLPKVYFEPNNIPFDCQHTWDMICDGNTKGIFQLETKLGQTWAKRAKPRNIEELGDLIALVRPGCLDSGMADRYVKIKRGEEKPSYIHESLRPILEKTKSILIYQEQSIEIVKQLAGFSLSDADTLRRAMGKKIPELMAKVEKQFLEQSEKHGVIPNDVAIEIFGWIRESQRYNFNLSHSIAYAINGYITAYAKHHFPHQFFCAYLRGADEKIDKFQEIRELIDNMRQMKINIKLPTILSKNETFYIKNDDIYFGIGDIKSVGKSVLGKLQNVVEEAETSLNKQLCEFTWYEFLIVVLTKINITAATSLIRSGALNHFRIHRKQMEYELKKFTTLSKGEQRELREAIVGNLKQNVEKLASTRSGRRAEQLSGVVKQLDNPSFDLRDTISDQIRGELETLGVTVTYNPVEDRDLQVATHNCTDLQRKISGTISVGAYVNRIKYCKTKKGKNPGQDMCFLEISDDSGSYNNVVIFPDTFTEFKHLLIEKNTLLLVGSMNQTSFAVNRISQL